MKKILTTILLASALIAIPAIQTGCKSTPNERVIQVQTLKASGQTAEAAVALSAQLYRDGLISADKARIVIDFYNLRFQPTYRLAVTAVRGDLNSLSSPELWDLLNQLTVIVANLQKPTP